MTREIDLTLRDGRTLHVYDTATPGSADGTGAEPDAGTVVVWHHGTPNVGRPPEPLLARSGRVGIRWLSYDRPGYGGSSPRPGRDVASAAQDVAELADAVGVERFAVMGHSGGSPHALACAALMPDRVLAVVCGASLAPYGADGLDWFAGMAAAGCDELRAALAGRRALTAHLEATDFDPEQFTPADHAALAGPWSWLDGVADEGWRTGRVGTVDDDLAYVAPWGFDPGVITAPVLVLHGSRDRVVPGAHGEWLAQRIPGAELWLRPEDGHLSVLTSAEDALDWLAARCGPR